MSVTKKKVLKPSQVLGVAFPNVIWHINEKSNTLYLTFDDGPIPIVTEWVLDILAKYNIKATFFCVGDNVKKHPAIFKQVKENGHAIGNHTFNHLNNWKTFNKTYINNIAQANELTRSNLFRPPYGKIRLTNIRRIQKKYKVILWDVLSRDYSKTITPQECFQNVIDKAKEGSIIVFHDSLKAFTNLQYALPLTIEYFLEKGFSFDKIIL